MTHAAGRWTTKPGAMLSRVLVALALVLFGAPHSHVDGVADTGAIYSQVDETQGILGTPRHLPSAHLPDVPSPDMVVPRDAGLPVHPLQAAALLPAQDPPTRTVAIRILPPVRGPPAA